LDLSYKIEALPKNIAPFLARSEIYVLKIATLFEISMKPTTSPVVISMESLNYAIKFIEFLFEQTRETIESQVAFNAFEKDRIKILNSIEKAQPITKSTLMRRIHLSAPYLDTILDTLMQEKTIWLDHGPDTPVYRVSEGYIQDIKEEATK
jgi:hypothetical protein